MRVGTQCVAWVCGAGGAHGEAYEKEAEPAAGRRKQGQTEPPPQRRQQPPPSPPFPLPLAQERPVICTSPQPSDASEEADALASFFSMYFRKSGPLAFAISKPPRSLLLPPLLCSCRREGHYSTGSTDLYQYNC